MGGPARAEVERMIAKRERDDGKWRKEVAARSSLIDSAERKLAALVARMASR